MCDILLRQFGLEQMLIPGHTNSFVATDMTPSVKDKVKAGLLIAHRADGNFARAGLIEMSKEFMAWFERQTSERGEIFWKKGLTF